MTAGNPTPRSAATLIFVPDLGRDPLSSTEVVAKSIAAEAGLRAGVVALKDDTAAAPRGMRSVGTVFVDGARVLDVLELDYRDAVEALDADPKTEREGVPPGLIQTLLYTLRGVLLWGTAALRLGKGKSKSRMAKAQLLLGVILAFILLLALLFLIVAAAAALLSGTSLGNSLPEWLTDVSKPFAGWGGLVTVAAYVSFRSNILRSAQRVRQLLRYLDEPHTALEISRLLRAGIDALADEGYQGKIHVLAYSFGSLVVLDDLVPDDGTSLHPRDPATKITSLVTVGCPYDITMVYFPRHYTNRRPRRPELPWRNIFIASDVLGSNFVEDKDDTKEGEAEVLGMKVNSVRYLLSEKLTWFGLLRQVGLRQHTKYWDKSGGCWVHVLDLWGL
jgi:hypothetical protein